MPPSHLPQFQGLLVTPTALLPAAPCSPISFSLVRCLIHPVMDRAMWHLFLPFPVLPFSISSFPTMFPILPSFLCRPPHATPWFPWISHYYYTSVSQGDKSFRASTCQIHLGRWAEVVGFGWEGLIHGRTVNQESVV